MAFRSISSVLDKWWDEVCAHLHSSLVFMDDAAAEILHWHGGLVRVLACGAITVHNLSIFEKVKPMHKKAVFIIASPLDAEILRTIMVIVRNSGLNDCTVITSLPPGCHEIEISDASQTFEFLERQLLSWMGHKALSAEVLHIPIFASCLLPEFFCIPTLSKFFFPVSTELELKNCLKYVLESSQKGVPDGMKVGIKVLAHSLNSMLEGLQLKGEIFSLGRLSHSVGVELESIVHMSKKKVASSKASVLLIDRSVDLAGPLSQATDTPFGKMLRILPHLPGHVCDISVCMEDISSCKSDTVFGFPLLAPGCIAHQSNSIEADILRILLTSKIKEAVMDINRKVVQVCASEGLVLEHSGPANALKMLKKGISSFREKPNLLAKYSGLLQQALSIVQTLEHGDSCYLDNLLATEKLLVQNYSLSKNGVAEDISRLIINRKERNYKMVDILSLVSFLYALSNEDVFDSEAEASVQAAIIEALFQDDVNTQSLVRDLAGDDADDQDILSSVKIFFNILKQFSDSRKDFKYYRNVFECGDVALPASYKPMLRQIMDSIFSSSEVPDLEFHSSGLRDYIKTGFSLFMNVAKPLPRDNPVLIVFVIGGATASEVKMMQEVASRHKPTKILFGSTSLLTPETVMKDLFDVVQKSSVTKEISEDF